MKTKIACLVSICIILIVSSKGIYSKSHNKVATQLELRKYWSPDVNGMSNFMPVDISKIVNKYNGLVFFKMRFTINKNGKPEGFELLSSKPIEAMAEEKYVKAYYMFLRYKPTLKNKNFEPTVFEGEIRWMDPARKKRKEK